MKDEMEELKARVNGLEGLVKNKDEEVRKGVRDARMWEGVIMEGISGVQHLYNCILVI